ncbi:MAG: ATP-dependent Clp protease ATP-binding subunit [Nitrospirae bacterium]|nr:ATP-dependent Clp protease ATP-binding subunit [Nitrospirota bacterium]
MSEQIMPKWAREIERFMPVKSQFILWGNIYDVYPIDLNGSVTTLKLIDYLKELLVRNGYGLIALCEPLTGLRLSVGGDSLFKEITGQPIPKQCTLGTLAELVEKLVFSARAYSAVILNFSSRLTDIAGNEANELYYRMFACMQKAGPVITAGADFPKYNLVIWCMDKDNDIPAWFTMDNPRLRMLSIPKPDYHLRKVVIESLSKYLTGIEGCDETKRGEIVSLFIDQTSGLFASEIVSIVAMARRDGIGFTGIGEAIRAYKLGIVENPWSRLHRERILNADSILTERVKGQPHAVTRAADIIKRAVNNLSGSQYAKYSQRPKGVMFLAGPTGVGKTELAKAVTELIFGTETSCIRFDMSEFSHEHADQRLLGSPPGYVGYDIGGQLTNAIKQTPFAVVLFDEIEKAHPRILDVFLQILDDGRLTSGRGETVYFSEALIVFTSNLGFYETSEDGQKIRTITQEMPFKDIDNKIRQTIGDFFKYKIGRPEILNRIGDNIVVFDFIRADVAALILNKMVNNVMEKVAGIVREKFPENYANFSIELSNAAMDTLRANACNNPEMGGRGIGNNVETMLVNPLSRELFALNLGPGQRIIIESIDEDAQSWHIRLCIQSI